ncbi:HEAT repeat domain-containing protein, partial [bacterium]|nr:HEAT repeat domain-containing protein [bacterium]
MTQTSALTRALLAWTAKGGDLDKALPSHGDENVKTEEEADAVCAALRAFRARAQTSVKPPLTSPLHTLTALFQQVEDERAFARLKQAGLPQLRLCVEDALHGKGGREEDILFILKILAMYQEEQDVDLIVRAARLPWKPDGFMWSVVLGQFDEDHPHAERLLSALRDPLPSGFLLVSYLDMANALAIAGRIKAHPFDSAPGTQQLDRWLRDENPDHFSYAHSATASLPFIRPKQRRTLLAIASAHPDVSVRLEAAWAQVKGGDPAGLDALIASAADPRYSEVAQAYLKELGKADRIPTLVGAPDFQALTEMSSWLAHPHEYGRPPRSIEVFDSRVLFWPPTNDTRRLWLLKYSYQDSDADSPDIGLGLVGSVTFALFG